MTAKELCELFIKWKDSFQSIKAIDLDGNGKRFLGFYEQETKEKDAQKERPVAEYIHNRPVCS
jgi:hypothetical protein